MQKISAVPVQMVLGEHLQFNLLFFNFQWWQSSVPARYDIKKAPRSLLQQVFPSYQGHNHSFDDPHVAIYNFENIFFSVIAKPQGGTERYSISESSSLDSYANGKRFVHFDSLNLRYKVLIKFIELKIYMFGKLREIALKQFLRTNLYFCIEE